MPQIPDWVCTSFAQDLELFASDDAGSEGSAGAPETIPLLPNRKHVRTRDGREFLNADPQALIDSVRAGGVDLVVGRDHDEAGSLFGGSPAPAAGWIDHRTGLSRDGKFGVKAKVMWTDVGRESIERREFRYISPVLSLDAQAEKGPPAVTGIMAASVVNIPALRMAALNKQRPGQATENKAIMDPQQYAKLCAALGLPEDANPETAIAAAEGRVGATQGASLDDSLGAISQLAAGMETLSAEVRELRAESEVRELGPLPEAVRKLAVLGIKAGGETAKLSREIVKRAAPGFAALTQEDDTQSADRDERHGLTDDDIAFCEATGLDVKTFAEQKAKDDAERTLRIGLVQK